MMPLPPLGDLELLARHAPTIYGRALDPDRPTLTPQPVNGRPDWVDGRSGVGGELGRAVGALRALLALDAEGAEGKRTAGVLWLVHVLCGTAAASRGYVLASAHFGILSPLPPEPPQPPQRGGRRGNKETREGDARLKAVHEAWKVACKRREAEGLGLYVSARAVWEARAVRRTG
jgi:hypothetical protein